MSWLRAGLIRMRLVVLIYAVYTHVILSLVYARLCVWGGLWSNETADRIRSYNNQRVSNQSETILIDRRSKLSGQLFKIVADGCRAIDVLSTRDYAELDANI